MREPSGLLRFRTPLLGTAAAALVLTAGALAIPAAGSLAGPSPFSQTVDAACSPDADAACALSQEAGNRKKSKQSKKSTHRSGTRKPTTSRTKKTSRTPKTSTTAKTTRTKTTKSPKPTTTKTPKTSTTKTRTTKTSTTKTGGTTTSTKTTTTGPTPSGTTTTRTTRTTAPTTTPPASILASTDFEDGTEQAWRGGNINIVEAAAHSGKYGMQVGGLDKGQQTQLTILVTDTSSWYQATVYLAVPDKSNDTACARTAAKTKGGGSGSTPDKVTLAAPGTEETAGKGVLAVSSTWAAVDLMFKPYASDSTVTIALTGSSTGPDLLYVDDVVIAKISAPRTSSTKGGHAPAGTGAQGAGSAQADQASGADDAVEAVEAKVADVGCAVAPSPTDGGGSVRARLRTAV